MTEEFDDYTTFEMNVLTDEEAEYSKEVIETYKALTDELGWRYSFNCYRCGESANENNNVYQTYRSAIGWIDQYDTVCRNHGYFWLVYKSVCERCGQLNIFGDKYGAQQSELPKSDVGP